MLNPHCLLCLVALQASKQRGGLDQTGLGDTPLTAMTTWSCGAKTGVAI